VGLPCKGGADTDENRNEKAGKGAEHSPANRWPVARQWIAIEAGWTRTHTERRLNVRHEGGDIAFVLVVQRRAMHLGALLQLIAVVTRGRLMPQEAITV
jgi:hypothetical protein